MLAEITAAIARSSCSRLQVARPLRRSAPGRAPGEAAPADPAASAPDPEIVRPPRPLLDLRRIEDRARARLPAAIRHARIGAPDVEALGPGPAAARDRGRRHDVQRRLVLPPRDPVDGRRHARRLVGLTLLAVVSAGRLGRPSSLSASTSCSSPSTPDPCSSSNASAAGAPVPRPDARSSCLPPDLPDLQLPPAPLFRLAGRPRHGLGAGAFRPPAGRRHPTGLLGPPDEWMFFVYVVYVLLYPALSAIIFFKHARRPTRITSSISAWSTSSADRLHPLPVAVPCTGRSPDPPDGAAGVGPFGAAAEWIRPYHQAGGSIPSAHCAVATVMWFMPENT